MNMNTRDDAELFKEKDYRIDTIIMTSFTEFDAGRIKRYLKTAKSVPGFNFNRMWLFQCNPVQTNNPIPDNFEGKIIKRIFKPSCKIIGEKQPISCRYCLESMNQYHGKPKKVFHPKVWLLRFINKNGEFFWRLIVSSKNMSKGAEELLDCYFCTDGKVNKTISSENHLAHFLDDLINPTLVNINWRDFEDCVEEIKTVKWDNEPNFIYINGENFDNVKTKLPWCSKTVEDMRILSPFLNERFVKYIYKKVCRMAKIYSNDKGFSSLSATECSEFRDNFHRTVMIVGEKERDWHAKIFVWKMDGKWYMMIGSLNATYKAFSDNTEFGVWFGIDEKDIPDWKNGEKPELDDSACEDNESKGENNKAFIEKESNAGEIDAYDQIIINEQLRNELLDEAKKTLRKKLIKVLSNKYISEGKKLEIGDTDDFESILFCQSHTLINQYLIDNTIGAVKKEYDQLSDYDSWKSYIEGCEELIQNIVNIKEDK